jgi:hypothetical protein
MKPTVKVLDLNYTPDSEEEQNRHQFDVSMKVRVATDVPMEALSREDIMNGIREEVEERTREIISGATKDPMGVTDGEANPSEASYPYFRLESFRLPHLERPRQDFVTEHQLEISIIVDSKYPVGPHVNWMQGRSDLAFKVANDVAEVICEKSGK